MIAYRSSISNCLKLERNVRQMVSGCILWYTHASEHYSTITRNRLLCMVR